MQGAVNQSQLVKLKKAMSPVVLEASAGPSSSCVVYEVGFEEVVKVRNIYVELYILSRV